MRILICGGRKFTDYKFMKLWLGVRFPIRDNLIIIHGGARGADLLAAHWAMDERLRAEEFKADWEKHGNRAGYIRNKQMLDEGNPDLVIAFPGRIGTAMMVKIAKEAGVPVEIVSYP